LATLSGIGAVSSVQESTIGQLTSDRVFNTLNMAQQRFGKERPIQWLSIYRI
jgi:hypothetical protein